MATFSEKDIKKARDLLIVLKTGQEGAVILLVSAIEGLTKEVAKLRRDIASLKR